MDLMLSKGRYWPASADGISNSHRRSPPCVPNSAFASKTLMRRADTDICATSLALYRVPPYSSAEKSWQKITQMASAASGKALFTALAVVFPPLTQAGTVDAIRPGSATKGSPTNPNR